MSGRVVPELTECVSLEVSTKCPGKWAFVDLQSGDVFVHDGTAFSRPSPEVLEEISSTVSASLTRN
jgi:hypothetical protein